MYLDDAKAVIKYLRDEADFNRAWTDGRRGNVSTLAYTEERLRIAAERDRWATSIEDLVKMASVRKPA